MFLLNCCPDDDLIFKKRWIIILKYIYKMIFFYTRSKSPTNLWSIQNKKLKTESNIFEILWENSESCMKLSFPNPNEGL